MLSCSRSGYRGAFALMALAWTISHVFQLLLLLPSMTEDLHEFASMINATRNEAPSANNRTDGILHQAISSGNDTMAIFFNAFVPPRGVGAGPEHATEIIQEQLGQRNESSAMRNVPVYYTLIGENVSDSNIFTPNCHMLQYATSGNEELTLGSLYEFCIRNPSARVTYIHDKGSFSKRPSNTKRRRFVTKAVFSNACATMPAEMCNICSLEFSVLPTHHAPGNMWTADCSYIQKLLPPRQFASKMREMYASLETCESNLTCAIQPNSTWPDNFLGLGRHAMEVWAYSHPQVRPCVTMEEAYVGQPSLEDFKPRLIRAPKDNKIRGIGKMTAMPWFQMEGRLYQYDYIYGEKPSEDSWFWNTYQYFKLSR